MIAWICMVSALATARWQAIPLVAGSTSSSVCGVSKDGKVVCGYLEIGGQQRAYTWTRDDSTKLVGSGTWYLWRNSGGIQFSAENAVLTAPLDVKAADMRWTRLVPISNTLIKAPTGYRFAAATDETADKAVRVGKAMQKRGTEGIVWTKDSGSTGIGVLDKGKHYSQINGLSADGTFAVGASDTSKGLRAFVWSKTTGIKALPEIGEEKGSPSAANCVSKDGKIVGGEVLTGTGLKAVLWIEGKGYLLETYLKTHPIKNSETSGASNQEQGSWILESVQAISDDGTILIGSAKDDTKRSRTLRITIQP